MFDPLSSPSPPPTPLAHFRDAARGNLRNADHPPSSRAGDSQPEPEHLSRDRVLRLQGHSVGLEGGGASRIAVWGDYFGLRLVTLPSMQVKTVANNINHGKVMNVVEHPNGQTARGCS